MKEGNTASVKEIMDREEGVTLHEKHGGKFYFPLYASTEMMRTSIDALDMTQRPYNCLKRRGIHTIGGIVSIIEGGDELKNLRNCGAKSVREIMEKLFLFQYNSLKPERRDRYLQEVVKMNQEMKCQGTM